MSANAGQWRAIAALVSRLGQDEGEAEMNGIAQG